MFSFLLIKNLYIIINNKSLQNNFNVNIENFKNIYLERLINIC